MRAFLAVSLSVSVVVVGAGAGCDITVGEQASDHAAAAALAWPGARASASSSSAFADARMTLFAGPITQPVYVSAGAPSGGDGSAAKPYSSIQTAANASKPGDTVLILNGTYGAFTISTSGTPAAWITYRAETGHSPRLQFADWGGSISKPPTSRYRVSRSWVTMRI